MSDKPTVEDRGAAGGGASAATALAFLRVTLGAMFVWVFFENLGKHLYSPDNYAGLINSYIEQGCAPAFWKGVMSVVASHAALMGPVQGFTEITFGVCLVLGLFTRPVALGAFFFLASLWVSEWCTAWVWELLVPMAVALGLLIGAAGRRWGVDAALAKRYPNVPLW